MRRFPCLLLEIIDLSSLLGNPLIDLLQRLVNVGITLQVQLYKFINKLVEITDFTLKMIALERRLVTWLEMLSDSSYLESLPF